MADSVPPRGSTQKARKTARIGGKRLSSSLAIINSALSESPLPERRETVGVETDIERENTPGPAMSNIVPRSRTTERLPTRHPSLLSSMSSLRVSSDPVPSTGPRRGEIDDTCYGNIVELFAKRYIQTFDKDRLALGDAYTSEAFFSCRFIPGSHSPSPWYFSKCNTGTLRGALSIVQALSSFSRQITFVPPNGIPLDVTIEVLQLSGINYFVTLTFDTIVEGAGVSVDMVFLLKDDPRPTGKQDWSRVLWTPFVVMSHQIILRS